MFINSRYSLGSSWRSALSCRGLGWSGRLVQYGVSPVIILMEVVVGPDGGRNRLSPVMLPDKLTLHSTNVVPRGNPVCQTRPVDDMDANRAPPRRPGYKVHVVGFPMVVGLRPWLCSQIN